jgi:dimethylhistidine N-methyltransferase
MSAIATKMHNVWFDDQQPTRNDSRAELLEGLLLPQKRINPKYLYDVRGSQLFDSITRLDEYYPTRCEMEILHNHASDIAQCCGSDCVLIEPGSGSSEKVRLLIDALHPVAYVPLDISADFLFAAARRLGREFPWLRIHAICADFSDREFTRRWPLRTPLSAGRRVIFYPGSTIGNMDPGEARVLLSAMRDWIGPDGGVLIGVDLHKSEALLHAAYNDAAGVTAEFNLNVLHSINRLANANFRRDRFSHLAFYNREQRRIEMHLVSKQFQSVRVDGKLVEFEKGESLHTENSYKYSVEQFSALGAAAGFTLQRSWFDRRRLFSFHYLAVAQT